MTSKPHAAFNRILALLLISMSLSGCYSLSDIWSGEEETAVSSNIKGPKESSDPRVSAEFVSSLRESSNEQNQKVREFVSEWKTMKPALMRVVALEEDMQFLLQTLNDVNAVGPVYSADNPVLDTNNAIQPDYEQAAPMNLVGTDSLQTRAANSAMPNNTANKFSGTNTAVKAQPAPKRINSLLSNEAEPNLNTTMSQVDNKFSGSSSTNNTANKFQQTALSDNNGNSTSDRCNEYQPTDIGRGSAVHLVSYKTKNLLSSQSAKLTATFSEVLCGKLPVVKEVMVNGSLFYSMRFGPFADKNEARKACSDIKKTGQYCGVTTFDGTQIL